MSSTHTVPRCRVLLNYVFSYLLTYSLYLRREQRAQPRAAECLLGRLVRVRVGVRVRVRDRVRVRVRVRVLVRVRPAALAAAALAAALPLAAALALAAIY